MRRNDYDNVYTYIQPNTDNLPIRFTHSVESASGENDGTLPYGTTVASGTTTAYKDSTTGWTSATDLIVSSTLGGNDLLVLLQYPATSGVGDYKITNVLTLSTGQVLELDYPLIQVINK